MGKRWKTLSKVGIWLGTAWAALRTLIWWIGDIQTVQQLGEDRGAIVGFLVTVVSSQWVGPVVVVVSLCLYWYLSRSDRTGAADRALAPADVPSNQGIAVRLGPSAWDTSLPVTLRNLGAGLGSRGVAGRLIIEDVTVTNRSLTHPVSLTVRLLTRANNRHVAASLGGPMENEIAQKILAHPINLQPTKSDHGRLVFDVRADINEPLHLEFTENLQVPTRRFTVAAPGDYPKV